MMTSDRIQTWRRAAKVAQVVLVLGIPLLRFNKESLLRFDVPSLTLLFFGRRIWMDEFFLVLLAVLFLGFLIASVTVVLGRVWCGWACPQTVIIDLTRTIDRSRSRSASSRLGSLLFVAMLSPILAAGILGYFVSPYDLVSGLSSGSLNSITEWSWAVLSVVTFLNFAFLRHTFCSTVCPYAKMQGAFYDESTLIIGADPRRISECMQCDACVRACPTGIDIRTGPNAACINCAECISACGLQMLRRERRSLIGYRWGVADMRPDMLRRGVLLPAVAAAVSFMLLLFMGSVRPDLSMEVAADPARPPQRRGNTLVNGYSLSITNRSVKARTMTLRVEPAENYHIDPSAVVLRPFEHVQSRIEVTMTAGRDRTDAPAPVTIIGTIAGDGARAESAARFLAPW